MDLSTQQLEAIDDLANLFIQSCLDQLDISKNYKLSKVRSLFQMFLRRDKQEMKEMGITGESVNLGGASSGGY